MKQSNYFISKEEWTEEQESKRVLSEKREYIDIPKQRNELGIQMSDRKSDTAMVSKKCMKADNNMKKHESKKESGGLAGCPFLFVLLLSVVLSVGGKYIYQRYQISGG